MTRFSNMRVDQQFTGSLRDEIRSACCAGKEAFDSPKMAAQVARRRKIHGEHYRCNVCGKYHICGGNRKRG